MRLEAALEFRNGPARPQAATRYPTRSRPKAVRAGDRRAAGRANGQAADHKRDHVATPCGTCLARALPWLDATGNHAEQRVREELRIGAEPFEPCRITLSKLRLEMAPFEL